MAVNRGKQFEDQVRAGLLKVPSTLVIRMIDPQGGQAGVSNMCDFVVYNEPHQWILECKSCYGNTLSIHTNNPKNKYGAISNAQWEGMLKAIRVPGVVAGVLVWFIDHDKTLFIPIDVLEGLRCGGAKSVNINKIDLDVCTVIPGTKRRVLFDYDFSDFLK